MIPFHAVFLLCADLFEEQILDAYGDTSIEVSRRNSLHAQIRRILRKVR